MGCSLLGSQLCECIPICSAGRLAISRWPGRWHRWACVSAWRHCSWRTRKCCVWRTLKTETGTGEDSWPVGRQRYEMHMQLHPRWWLYDLLRHLRVCWMLFQTLTSGTVYAVLKPLLVTSHRRHAVIGFSVCLCVTTWQSARVTDHILKVC